MAAGAIDQTMVMAVAHVTRFAAACERRADVEVFAVLEEYYGLADQVIRVAGGRVIKCMGDGVLFVFPTDAARAAVRALEQFRSAGTESWRVLDGACEVEINVHVGRVATGELGPAGERHFDIAGKAVNELFRMPWNGLHLSAKLSALLEAQQEADAG